LDNLLLLLALAVHLKQPPCFGTSAGSVTAGTVSGACGYYQHSWKKCIGTGAGTLLPFLIFSWSYALTVTDNCSTKTNSVTVGQPATALVLWIHLKLTFLFWNKYRFYQLSAIRGCRLTISILGENASGTVGQERLLYRF
jgi:hypothetical protein